MSGSPEKDGLDLVTGGAGFLGSALCRSLLDAGHRVRSLDDHSRGKSSRIGDLPLDARTGDIRDLDAIRAAMEGVDTVWHLAMVNGTRFFYERPDTVIEVAIKGTLNVIDAAVEAGVRRLVYASSSEVYHHPTTIPTPVTERIAIPDITNPRFSYGGGKIAGELLTLHLAARRGLEVVIVRPHNVYGPDMGNEHVIPDLATKLARAIAAAKTPPGGTVALTLQGDGTDTRAFCHIDDAAEGFRIAGVSGANGGIYHLGTPEEVTIAHLAHAVGAVLGVDVTLETSARPVGGTPRRCPDISALAALGYAPRVSLTDGLAAPVRWYAERAQRDERA